MTGTEGTPVWFALAMALLSGGVLGGVVGGVIDHWLGRREQREAELLAQQRAAYQQLTSALRVFVGSTPKSAEQEAAFLTAYDTLWLWGGDDLLETLNRFVQLNEDITAGRQVEQATLRTAYAECVIMMRRELGFPDTKVTSSNYRFVDF